VGLDWDSKPEISRKLEAREMNLMPALMATVGGAVLATLLARLPFLSFLYCLPCQWVGLGGFLAPAIYQWVEERRQKMGGGLGVLLGLFSGVFSAFLDLGLLAVRWDTLLTPEVPPRMVEAIRELSQATGVEDPRLLVLILTGLVFLMIYPLVSGMGGLLGAAVFGRSSGDMERARG
jgi:hypothetical protein